MDTVNNISSGGVKMLTVLAVAQSQSDIQAVDWTQLPDACRMLVARLMDRATRSAWAAVCHLTRQDVHADVSVMTWSGYGQWQMHQTPFPQDSSRYFSFTTTLPATLHAWLPYLKHLNCSGMPQLTSIQGVPPTLRSLDLSFCHHLNDVAALQHCTALEQLTLTGYIGAREGLAATLPPAMSAISPHLRRLKLQVFDLASDAVTEAVVRSFETLTGLQELSLYMRAEAMGWITNKGASRKMLARAVACMTDLRVLDLTAGGGCDEDLYGYCPLFNELAPAIAHLRCLQSLNLSGIGMHCESAGVAAETLAQSLFSMPATLTRLDLTGAVMLTTDVTVLVPIFQAHSATLKFIGLSFSLYSFHVHPLGADGLARLLPGLQCCSALTDIDLTDGRVCTDGGVVLAAVLKGCAPRLTSLDLCRSALGDEGAACFAAVLRCMTALSKLGLRNTLLGPAGAASLATALSHASPPLTSLDLRDNPLASEGVTALAPALSSIGPSLTSLNLSGIRLTCEGAAALAPALTSIAPSLTSLRLARNGLGSTGALQLAPALSRMTALATLAFRSTGLGPAGATSLAPALSSIAPALTSLDLSNNNQLDDKGAEALAPALSRMTALATLTYSCNRLGLAGATALAPALLSIAPSLKSLELSHNAMSADSIATLAPAMRNMTALEHLSLSGNNIDLVGAATLASVLPVMVQLKRLELRSNCLGLEGLRALAQGLQTLSGQQSWHIGYPVHLVRGSFCYELCHLEDAAELATITDGLSFLRQWEVVTDYHAMGSQPDAGLKVLGLTVDL